MGDQWVCSAQRLLKYCALIQTCNFFIPHSTKKK